MESKILIIDDDVDFTRLVKSKLEKTGRYEVQVENNSFHGIDEAKAFKPDLILLDFMMPGVDGSEVAERMKEDKDLNKTPIVFLTSMVSDEEVESRAGLIGGNRFIAKAQPMQKIIDSIEQNISMVR